MDDQRRGDSALMRPLLVIAKRRVRQIRPGAAIARVGVLSSRYDRRLVAHSHPPFVTCLDPQDVRPLLEAFESHERQGFVGRAVVGKEDHQRVFEVMRLRQCAKDLAYALIHPVDLRSVDFHAPGLPLLVLGLVPSGLGRIPVAQRGRVVEDIKLAQAPHPTFAQNVPALVECTPVFRNVLLTGVQRPVRRGVRDIKKERLPGRTRVMIANECSGLGGYGIGVKKVRPESLVFHVDLASRQRARLEIGATSGQGAEETVEAPARRPGIVRFPHFAREMPLARKAGGIARRLEHLGNRDAAVIDRARVATRPVIVREDADAGLMRMQAGKQRRARGAAACRVVKLREPDAAIRQPIEVRRPDFASVAADIRKSHIVDQDEHNVGPRHETSTIRFIH